MPTVLHEPVSSFIQRQGGKFEGRTIAVRAMLKSWRRSNAMPFQLI